MRCLLHMPCKIIGSLMVIAWLTDFGSLLIRRREICDLNLESVAVGMGWFKSAMTWNLEGTDGFGIFLEADGRNTKEPCSLLLRAWSKEIKVDWAGRTNLGGEDEIMPANHRHENRIKQSFWIPTGLVYFGVENKQIKSSYWKRPWYYIGASWCHR